VFAALGAGPWAYVHRWPDPADTIPVAVAGPPPAEYRVYVADWGYHTSIIVPQPPGLAFGPSNDVHAAFVEFAWGDRSFYMQSNYWPHRLFATLFLPTASVTYLAGWPRAPVATDGMTALWSRAVTLAELTSLYAALEGSIRHMLGKQRQAAYPPANGYRGRFYPAHGYYLFWADCNRWTVDQLHGAGLAKSGTGVVLAQQVAARLQGFRRE
jgi:hypothetical protein